MYEAYIKLLKNFANFSGRSRRRDYWLGMLASFISTILLGMLSSFIPPLAFVAAIYPFVLFLAHFSLAARRLHDIGKSGWWQLIILVPAIGALFLLYFLCCDSGPDNKYGPNPKRPYSEAEEPMGHVEAPRDFTHAGQLSTPGDNIGWGSIAKMSVVCWIAMLAFSVLWFHFIGGRFHFRGTVFPMLSSTNPEFFRAIYLNILRSVVLLTGAIFSISKDRRGLMVFPLGICLIETIVRHWTYLSMSARAISHGFYGFIWSNPFPLVEVAAMASVTFVFFLSVKKRIRLEAVTITSVICMIACGVVIASMRSNMGRSFLEILIDPFMLRTLSFFAGTAFLGASRK